MADARPEARDDPAADAPERAGSFSSPRVVVVLRIHRAVSGIDRSNRRIQTSSSAFGVRSAPPMKMHASPTTAAAHPPRPGGRDPRSVGSSHTMLRAPERSALAWSGACAEDFSRAIAR